MSDKVPANLTWSGKGEAVVVPRLPGVTDPLVTKPTPEISFSTDPQGSAYTYTVGINTYTPDGIFYTAIDTEITFTAVVVGSSGIVEYHWDFGDGVEGWDNPAAHTYKLPNKHIQAVLRVTDTKGRKFYARRAMYLT